MTKEELKTFVQGVNPNAEFNEEGQYLTAIVPAVDMRKLAEELRTNETSQFDFLFCQTALDYPGEEDSHMMVVYHFVSTELKHTLVVKAKITNRDKPEIETVCDIWRTAEFHEREIYDLFGVVFTNHPDLRRIFLDDEWVGYPLRKDYVDEVNIVDLH